MLSSHELAQASFKYFFVNIYGMKWAPHFDEWYDLMWNNRRFLLECARGHGKTVFLVGFALWLIYRQIPTEILFFSHSEEQVKMNIMTKIEEAVMKNDYLSHLRPDPSQMWGAQVKTFKNGSMIRGESFGSSTRGAHPDWIFEDDPLKDKGGMSPEEQHNYHMTVISGMAKKDTTIGVIGTPLDKGDLLEQLETNPMYRFKSYPALTEQGEPLFPTLYSKEQLQDKEKEVGTFAFSREFLLKRLDTKNQMFKDQFRTLNESYIFPTNIQCVRTIIDPAASEKEGACDTAITSILVDTDNHKWELETRLIQADNPTKVIEEVLKVVRLLHDKYYDYAVVCETEVFQKWVANDLKQAMLKENLSVNIIEVTHQSIQGKHQRISGLQPSWEARGIHLLPESPLIEQFRYYRPNIRGYKIDAIDAFAWIRDERVAVPVTEAVVYDPGVPDEAWE